MDRHRVLNKMESRRPWRTLQVREALGREQLDGGAESEQEGGGEANGTQSGAVPSWRNRNRVQQYLHDLILDSAQSFADGKFYRSDFMKFAGRSPGPAQSNAPSITQISDNGPGDPFEPASIPAI
jgi:hypothetical protein